jgi:Secretion system C-terminal sorting domain
MSKVLVFFFLFNFAKLAEIDFIISHPLADFPTLEQTIGDLSDSIKQMIPAYLTYQKTLDDLSFSAHVNLGATQTNVDESSILSLSTELNTKTHLADSVKIEKWQKALDLNSNLVIENNITQLEQQINVVYLALLLNNQSVVNIDDSLLVKTLAYYCPQEYGDVVIKARSIWVQMGNAVDKTWDDCFPTGVIQQGENRSNPQIENSIQKKVLDSTKPFVFPNPTSDFVNVFVPENYVNSHYSIYNSLGCGVFKGVFIEQNSHFDTSKWSNGIYYIQILSNQKRPITLKLVVQKL